MSLNDVNVFIRLQSFDEPFFVYIIPESPSQHLLFVQTQPLPGIFPYCTGNMERLHVDESYNLSKLSSGLSARQCEHELALAENNGVVDIVETPQLNPYEQARAQRIAKLQARLAPLERQAAELSTYSILSLPLQTRVVLKCRFVANMCVNVYV
jgi:hypothetical protein